MEKKTYIAAVLFLAVAYAVWSGISGAKSGWVCKDGQWVAQGNPSSEKPSYGCVSGDMAGFIDEKKEAELEEDTRSDEEKVQWDRIVVFVKECGVKSVSQNHNREVTITLKNTLRQKAIEAKLDDIVKVVRDSEEKCGKIEVLTE